MITSRTVSHHAPRALELYPVPVNLNHPVRRFPLGRPQNALHPDEVDTRNWVLRVPARVVVSAEHCGYCPVELAQELERVWVVPPEATQGPAGAAGGGEGLWEDRDVREDDDALVVVLRLLRRTVRRGCP